mgnify:CR=1 FL=1
MSTSAIHGFEAELLALDIDDTLTTFLGSIDEPVADAIGRASAAGITVVLATGRSLSTTAPIARAADLSGWVVCSNGAVLATVEPETIIEAITFDPGPLLDMLTDLLPGAVYAVEDARGVFHTTELFPAGALGMSIRKVPFEHLLADPVCRVVVRSADHSDEGFGVIAQSLGMHSVIFGVGDVAWMDIGPQGVNKATMLADLCMRLDINPARTACVGDSWNDIEMLRWAGLGVAMGSAPARVQAAADAVTSAQPGQGVIDVIDALLA